MAIWPCVLTSSELTRALGVEVEVDCVAGRALRPAHGDVGNAVSRHERGVADTGLLEVHAREPLLDVGADVFVLDVVDVHELEDALAGERVEDGLGVFLSAGNLHQEGVAPLLLDRRRRGTGCVDAVGDDLLRLAHLVTRDCRAVVGGRAQVDGDAALDVEAHGDLVLRGIQQEHRRDEGREDDDEGDDAALLAPAACLGGRAVRGLVCAPARAALHSGEPLLAHRLLLGLGARGGLGLLLGAPALLFHLLLAARLELFRLATLLLEILGIVFQGLLAGALVGGLLARLRCHLLVALGVTLLPCPVLLPLLRGLLALFRELRVHLVGLSATALLAGR